MLSEKQTTNQVAAVEELLREGRAALHTSIASYKFLITYGLLFSVLKLACYYYGVIMCQVRVEFWGERGETTLTPPRPSGKTAHRLSTPEDATLCSS